jgi:hypothetical protein
MHLVIMYLKSKATHTIPETDANDDTEGNDNQLAIALPSTSQEVLSEEVSLRILNNCDKQESNDYLQARAQCKDLFLF